MSYRYGGIGYETVLFVDTAQRDSGGAAIPMLYLFDKQQTTQTRKQSTSIEAHCR